MKQDWNKWLLATLMLGMAWSPEAAKASEATDTPKQGPFSFHDYGDISLAKRKAVDEAVKQGLLSGYPDDSFRPNQLLTRQELAVLLVNAMHLQPKKEAASSFEDTKDSWAGPYIEALVQAGLIDGSDHTFRPSAPVTREEMAAVFVRAINGVDVKGGQAPSLKDGAMISNWAEGAVSSALRLGLMSSQNSSFEPLGHVERQDIATYLLDIFQAKEQTATIERIDGDLVIIDGKPYLIKGALKELFVDKNKEALEGAILQYKSLNRNVDDLSKLQIVKSGTEEKPIELDVKGTNFKGELSISADHIVVKGETIPQVILKPGAGHVELNAKVAQMVIATDKAIQLKGSGAFGELKVANSQASIQLGKGIQVEMIELPATVKPESVIQNYDAVKGQIATITHAKPAPGTPTPVASAGTSGSSSSENSSHNNHAPLVIKTLKDRQGTLGAGDVLVDVSQIFSDHDQDVLTLHASTSSSVVADVYLTGSTLSVRPHSEGTSLITVHAADGKGGTASTSFHFDVLPASNHAPVSQREIDSIHISEGDPAKSIPISDLFVDEDGDALTLSVSSENTSVAEAVYNNGQVLITPKMAGSTLVKITAADGKGGVGETSVQVVVNSIIPVNHDPKVKDGISPVTAGVLDGLKTVSLANAFSDEDGDSLTYTAAAATPGVVGVQVDGNDLKITPVNAGTTTITVAASDGNGGTVDAAFSVTVTPAPPVNHDPKVKDAISSVTAGLLDGLKTVSLANAFSDEDGDSLTYTAAAATPGVVSLQVDGSDLRITPVNAGTTTVTVTASDGNGGTVNAAFSVAVTPAPPVNHDPKVKDTISPVTVGVLDGMQTVSLTNAFSDEDGDSLTVTAAAAKPGVVGVQVDGSDLKITPVNAGTTTVTVTASDGNGGTVDAAFSVTVTPALPTNHAPTIKNALQPLTLNLMTGALNDGNYKKNIDISGVFQDADGDSLTYSVTSSNLDVATAAMNGNDVDLTPLSLGVTTIAVTANDGNGGTISTSFDVTFEGASLFFSEIVMGTEIFKQFIEIHNPTIQPMALNKLRIVRSDGGEVIDFLDSDVIIPSNQTVVIKDLLNFDEDITNISGYLNLFAEDENEKVSTELALYYGDSNTPLDVANANSGVSQIRKSGIIIGTPNGYEPDQWEDEATDYFGNLNDYSSKE